MYPVTGQFLAALRGPHRVVTLVEHSTSPNVPDSWEPIEYPPLSGKVTVSRRSDARRSLSLTVGGVFNPTQAQQGHLNPYGGFLRVWRGIEFIGNKRELVPLGVFRTYETVVKGNTAEVTGYSLEQDVKDARFPSPWQWVASATIHDNLHRILIDGNILATGLYWDPTLWNPIIHRPIFEKDRLDAVKDLATSAGGEFSALPDGRLQVRRPGQVTDTPVWWVDAGPEGVLVEYSKTFSRQGVYNGVVVTNETINSTATPIRVFVWDNDPKSPTYWFGNFGKVPRFYTSEFIYTQAQARDTANSLLAKEKGLQSSISLEAVPNPALDVDDVIMVVYPDGSSEPHLIDSLSIGLGVDETMNCSSRAIQAPTEEVM